MLYSGLTTPAKAECNVADGTLSKVAEQNKRWLVCLVVVGILIGTVGGFKRSFDGFIITRLDRSCV